MDGAQVLLYYNTDTSLSFLLKNERMTSRRMREGCYEPLVGRPTGKRPLVQILVVVANTQVNMEA